MAELNLKVLQILAEKRAHLGQDLGPILLYVHLLVAAPTLLTNHPSAAPRSLFCTVVNSIICLPYGRNPDPYVYNATQELSIRRVGPTLRITQSTQLMYLVFPRSPLTEVKKLRWHARLLEHHPTKVVRVIPTVH